MKSGNYLEVSLSELEAVLAVGTFDGSVALASDVAGMACVLLGQAEKSVDGLRVCQE